MTSLHYPNAALARQRSRPWNSEVDSLQNAIDAFKVGGPRLLNLGVQRREEEEVLLMRSRRSLGTVCGRGMPKSISPC